VHSLAIKEEEKQKAIVAQIMYVRAWLWMYGLLGWIDAILCDVNSIKVSMEIVPQSLHLACDTCMQLLQGEWPTSSTGSIAKDEGEKGVQALDWGFTGMESSMRPAVLATWQKKSINRPNIVRCAEEDRRRQQKEKMTLMMSASMLNDCLWHVVAVWAI
jgi:hypothetical protein